MVIDVQDTADGPKAVRVGGDPTHPVTRGALCVKVNKYLERTYSDDRLLYPMRRIGPKGEGRFERITWDEAIALFTSKLRERIDAHGPQTVLPYSYAGTMGLLQSESLDRRFFHRLGASLLARTICASAGADAVTYTFGSTIGMPPEAFAESEVILLWGTNTITSNPHLWPFVRKAQKNGATVVCIDPRRTRTAERADHHVAPHPGTDAALALGMMHVLFRDGHADRGYLETATNGAKELEERVKRYPPEKTDAICGLPSGTTEWLARLYASTKKAAIRVNYGMQRHYGGGTAIRTVACIPAVTGAYREFAGGFQLSTSGAANLGLYKHTFQRKDWIPAGTRTINMSRLGEALLETEDPPITFLCVYNSNPAAVAPDQGRVTKGLLREDLFTVVLEQFPTDTTDYADLVLPATTQLEHWDLHTAYGHYYVTLNAPSIPPRGEALPNTEIFRRIAHAWGWDSPDFLLSDRDLIREVLETDHPYFEGITLERLDKEHWVRLALPERFTPYANGSPYTDDGKIHIVVPELEEIGLDPVPGYLPPAEDPDRDAALGARYPLRFISPPAHHFLNSTFVNVLKKHERPRPWVEIHPDDAAARGIQSGDEVTLFNDRGHHTLVAEVTDASRPGTVVAPNVWWRKFSPDGSNANALTPIRDTDIGGGATFYDCLVQVKKA